MEEKNEGETCEKSLLHEPKKLCSKKLELLFRDRPGLAPPCRLAILLHFYLPIVLIAFRLALWKIYGKKYVICTRAHTHKLELN